MSLPSFSCTLLMVLTGWAVGMSQAHAGRPMSSDDASAADAGVCQMESWLQHAMVGQQRVVAPACGLIAGLEFGGDYTVPMASSAMQTEGGLSAKWAPQSWRHALTVGELSLGLKWSAGYEQTIGTGWQRTDTSLLALASLDMSEALALHANLGPTRQTSDGQGATLLNLAVVWTPRPQAVLFAETQTNDKRQTFGGTVNAVGGRWWLQKDKLGLDLSAYRESGAQTGTSWTLGFGWYGLGR